MSREQAALWNQFAEYLSAFVATDLTCRMVGGRHPYSVIAGAAVCRREGLATRLQNVIQE
jgi:hypothetical protein